MKILVTGHMGLIGRALARELKGMGHDIHAADIKAGRDCRETFKENSQHYDVVAHCARDLVPARRMATNADWADWVDRTQTKDTKLIFISSEFVYPKSKQQEPSRLSESDAGLEDDDPDGMVDWAGERMALARGAKVFRPFQVYGEAGSGIFEEIADLVKTKPSTFNAPSCGKVLDFIHVHDAVSAIVASLDVDLDGPVNLCSGDPVATDELAEMMLKFAGYEPKRFLCDPREEQLFRCGDNAKMLDLSRPRVSLSQGIALNFSPTSN